MKLGKRGTTMLRNKKFSKRPHQSHKISGSSRDILLSQRHLGTSGDILYSFLHSKLYLCPVSLQNWTYSYLGGQNQFLIPWFCEAFKMCCLC